MTLYEISVRQTRDLPVVSLFPHPASFRFHLTMDTLAFGYILPTTGWIRDFNPLETCAARRTRQKSPAFTLTIFYCISPLFHSLTLNKMQKPANCKKISGTSRRNIISDKFFIQCFYYGS